MFRIVVIASMFFALAGCAALQKVSGDGRYLQFSVDGEVFAQADLPSSVACKRVGKSIETNGNFELKCSLDTSESSLPYSYTATNTYTNESQTARTRTLKACEQALKDAKNEDKKGVYEYTDCK